MAILYQYVNPIIAVTDTMKRPNHEPDCNRMIQGGLVSWNCIRGFLQLNPRPRCMFGFSNLQLLPAEKKAIWCISILDSGLFDSKLLNEASEGQRAVKYYGFCMWAVPETLENLCRLVETHCNFFYKADDPLWHCLHPEFRVTCCYVGDRYFVI